MTVNVVWALQQLIPPLLLSYFYAAWKLCTFSVGSQYILRDRRETVLGGLYTALPTVFILPITILYLRLYFLPASQSVPPRDPPSLLRDREVIFECLSPGEAEAIRRATDSYHDDELDTDVDTSFSLMNANEPLVNRCYKGRCAGRWKPARTRHCSQCGVCRGGFDHHCPFFANCLTAPYMPAFLALLTYTPIVVVLLSLPLYAPLYRGALAAYDIACKSESIRVGWWDWWASWVIAGGPVGRYMGGIILGWRELDRTRSDRAVNTLLCGAVVGMGHILAFICIGLAYKAVSSIISGDLLIDQGRAQAHMRTLLAIRRLESTGQPIPEHLKQELERWSDRKHFFVPLAQDSRELPERVPGLIVAAAPDERVYDYGSRKNWELIMGPGWGWLLPWRAFRRGVTDEVLFNWPVNDSVQLRLREQETNVQSPRGGTTGPT